MSIIAISGKIGSGKDTVGKIIQYLIARKNDYCPNKLDCYSNQQLEISSDWQIVKFADALKDIVCILTGCTRKQLEDIDFKNSYLDDKWKYYRNANDNTTYNYETYNGNVSKLELISLTYRELLQYLGTNLLRNQLHEDVWVNALFSKYKGINYTHISEDCPRQGIYEVTEEDELQYGEVRQKLPNWIITDCRFPNEAKAVKDRYGIVIKINRASDSTKIGCDTRNRIQHISERALDDYNFDYIINNDESIEDLISKVKEILIKEKII